MARRMLPERLTRGNVVHERGSAERMGSIYTKAAAPSVALPRRLLRVPKLNKPDKTVVIWIASAAPAAGTLCSSPPSRVQALAFALPLFPAGIGAHSP